jgi:regulator of PEP synthase PpsR (kinase-PPPase family)
MTSPQKQIHVFVVSDATGTTAERMIGAALVKFDQVAPVFRKFSYVKTRQEIETILHEADRLNAILIYSLVSEELRH